MKSNLGAGSLPKISGTSMSNYKFELSQIVFVIPVKMKGVIESRNKPPSGENVYEVGVMYQSRIWKTTFNESELTNTLEDRFSD